MNADDTEFQITLPSNTNQKEYPSNKASSYRTKLSSAVHLHGRWEVAVVDIQYPHNWHNVLKDTFIAFSIVPSSTPASSVVKSHRILEDEEFAHEATRQMMVDYEKSGGYETGLRANCYVRMGKISAGYYASVLELGLEICSVFRSVFAQHFDVELKCTIDPKLSKLMFSFVGVLEAYIYCNNDYLFNLLGILNGQKHTLDPSMTFRKYSKSFQSSRKPHLELVPSMYLYSDIIKYQMVGDIEAPLLGVLPCLPTTGSQVYWAFNPPYYIPLIKNDIDTIQIKVTTDAGDEVPFADDGKVICRLNFRRK